MEYIKTYLDDLLLLTITNNIPKDHLLKLEMVLARLSTTGMRFNISQSKFFAEQIDCLGYRISRLGIQPIRNKVELLDPLTSLTSSKVKFEWHSSHQQVFDKIKKVIGTEVLLCYPDFNKPLLFHVYTDASDHQLQNELCQKE
jgi:hypothetical protein